MGSFKGHALPGSLFLLVGLWRIWNCITRYVSNPKSHRVRIWHPLPGVSGNLKYLEIYIIIIGSFVDMSIEFLYSTHLKIFVHGVLNPSHMNDFEHAGMLLMFFIFGIAVLVSEKTRYLPLPHGALELIAAMAFGAEYLLFSFHSTSHAGLEGRYHQILVLLVGLCIVSVVLGAAFPTSFVVDLLSGMAITAQGIWFYQVAFALYGPMMPSGCSLKSRGIVCQSKDSEIRGQFLANFQLSMVLLLLIAVVLILFGYAARRSGHSNLYKSNNQSQGKILDQNCTT
uniref:Transmembrane protein 45B n=1 Tax=Araucaria cunninghamii TaxID=56994 RepID=A0A0D6QTI4_ARACU